MARSHIALFSQTGSEIVRIAERLERWPDLVVTNKRPHHLRKISDELKTWFTLPNKPTVSDYYHAFDEIGDHPVITLHGWLRIIPPEICSEYEIYNGHPGLITKYPELKGKDPQEKAWELCLQTSGCVIHRVTEGVDEGPILMVGEIDITKLDLNEVFTKLRDLSVDMWVDFLKMKDIYE